MTFDDYIFVVERRFKKNHTTKFDIEEKGVKIDFFASSFFVSENVYKNKFTPFNCYEIYEKYYFKYFPSIDNCDLQRFFEFLLSVAKDQNPEYQHLHNSVTGIVVCDNVSEPIINKIHNCKSIKPFNLYFNGWVDIHAICIDLSNNNIIASNDYGKSLDRFKIH